MKAIFIFLLLVCGAPVFAAPPAGKHYVLVLEDNFDGTSLDLKKWSYNYPWSTFHNHMANMRPQQVAVTNGELVITAIAQRSIWEPWGVNTPGGYKPLDYTSGAIHTRDHLWVGRGYIEGRFWMPAQWSTWPAFWMLQEGWPPEIDIFELQNERTRHHFYYHYGPDWQNEQSFGSQHWGPDKSQDWHTYGVEWEDDRMTFYFDDVKVGSWVNLSAIQQAESMYLLINLGVGGWAQDPVAAEYPAKLRCDWVRVWRRAELLSNGGMETGRGPWTRRGATTDVVAGEGTAGSKGYRLGASSAGDAAIEQTAVGLVPSSDYVLSGFARGSTNGYPTVRLGAKNYGGPEVFRSTASLSFVPLAVPFKTGWTNTTALLYGWTPGGATRQGYLDEVRLGRAATVMDPDFEYGDSDFWWSESYGGRSLSTAQVRSGAHSLVLNGTWSAAQQTVRGLYPGTMYELSAWVRGGGNAVLIGAKDFPAETNVSVTSAAVWTKASLSFRTGAASTNALVYAFMPSYNNSPAYIDDFFLAEPLKGPWRRSDIGSVGLAGSSGMQGDHVIIRGAGGDIWGTADAFHFVFQYLTGDGRITARVLKLDDSDPNAKAGLMMRESVAANGRHVSAHWMPRQRVEALARTSTGGSTVSAWSGEAVSSAPWVRIERVGNLLTTFYSTNAINWIQLSTQSISMPTTIPVGVQVCAHNTARPNEGIFSEISVVPYNVRLAVEQQSDTLVLSWPETVAAYDLFYTTQTTAGSWAPVPQSPVVQSGKRIVTMQLPAVATFYRLQAQ